MSRKIFVLINSNDEGPYEPEVFEGNVSREDVLRFVLRDIKENDDSRYWRIFCSASFLYGYGFNGEKDLKQRLLKLSPSKLLECIDDSFMDGDSSDSVRLFEIPNTFKFTDFH